MIRATVFWQGKTLQGFDISGHAGHGPYGQDIVCSAVSVLAIATVNSLLEQVGKVLVKSSDDGMVSCRLPEALEGEAAIKAQAVMKTLLIGLNGVAMEYPEHMTLTNITD